jgi:regulator of RNase E activity RraA
MTTIGPNVLTELARYDTPTICNAIELFAIRPQTAGYTDWRIRACFPELPPVVGFAATATFRGCEGSRGADGYASLEAQIERFAELVGPPVVVFQDLDDPPVAATFGEVMCRIYQVYGARGLITSGAGRDLEQVRALAFPVFTGGSICSHGYYRIPDIHVPVRVGGLLVHPDDLLHADLNGITCIPSEIAAEVAEVAGEFVASEAALLSTLRGETPPSVRELAQARAEHQARLEQLRRRVARRRD